MDEFNKKLLHKAYESLVRENPGGIPEAEDVLAEMRFIIHKVVGQLSLFA